MVIREGEKQLGVISRHEQPKPAGVVVQHGRTLTDCDLVRRIRPGVHELKRLPAPPLVEGAADNDVDLVIVVLVVVLLPEQAVSLGFARELAKRGWLRAYASWTEISVSFAVSTIPSIPASWYQPGLVSKGSRDHGMQFG